MKAEDKTKTDKQIIELIKSEDEEVRNKGFFMLIIKNNDLIEKQITFQINDKANAEAIFDKSVTILCKKIISNKFEYRGEGSIRAYLRAIIKGKISNESKKKKLAELTGEILDPTNPLQPLFIEDALKMVKEILDNEIGDDCRKIIIKHKYEGVKLEEIAKEMGLTHSVTKNKSSKCMKKLKTRIKEDAFLAHYLRKYIEDLS